MLKKFILGVVFSTIIVCAQTATYKDVGVIINSNSSISDSIGSYFVQQRRIPSCNIIRISVPVSEEITDSQFIDLRNQVETYLTTNGIKDSLNYLVTTKGVPLKVKRASTSAYSSVESELALILGPYASKIGGNGRMVSPYYRQSEHFTRSRYGIYIVTRLDGYTFNDVKGLIDRTSIIGEVIPTDAPFVFDIDPLWNSMLLSLNLNMSKTARSLSSQGLSVEMDSTTTYITHRQNVLGYTSWGSNDKNTSLNGRVYNTWALGAIAETYVSTSGRSFTSPPQYGQSLIADLISEGITAAKGYVYEPYSSAMADVTVLFDRYTNGYTIAESYYSASPYLSWMDVVIGDPKYRLIKTRLPSDAEINPDEEDGDALPVELISFTASVSGINVILNWATATEMNNYGFEVQRSEERNPESVNGRNGEWVKVGFIAGSGNTSSPKDYTFVDNNLRAKKYSYRLKQIDNDGTYSYSHEMVATIVQPQMYLLKQNYPNPFNPNTEIRFQISEASNVTLNVFDMLGRNIKTLINEMKEAGEHAVEFSASDLSSGIYFYTLRVGNFTETKKMLLQK